MESTLKSQPEQFYNKAFVQGTKRRNTTDESDVSHICNQIKKIL
jgi:hypothetical protein